MKNKEFTLENIEAVIFDMDGVLIDSEPVWKDAMEEVFAAVGCPLTREDFQKTVGLRLDEVITYWYGISPWEKVSPEEVMQQIINRMVALLSASGKPLTGVVETLRFLKQKGLKIGLATSSYEVLIDCVLDTLNIREFFDFTHSAEREAYGKPHPAVYLTTAETLGVNPQNCLVIEDSINGVISGKAARMHVVCIPEKTHIVNPKLILADYQFESMDEMLEALKK
ncbi:MAG: hexitol phosphatase HxpB [Crocinitomicaceae bacterium]|nr:hexitol phosphatase HxpB [Crocinitomicaceae bacterium]